MTHRHNTPFSVDRLTFVSLDDAEQHVQDGWVAQFRSDTYISRVIRAATGGVHSHSAMLGRHAMTGIMEIMEVRELYGTRIVPLRDYVIQRNRQIDIFAINKRFVDFDGRAAAEYMRRIITRSRRYSYWNIGRLLLRKIPFLWRLVEWETDDTLSTGNISSHCSQAVAEACRLGGGVDPVPRLPDYLVDPNHLTRSLLFDYWGTIER